MNIFLFEKDQNIIENVQNCAGEDFKISKVSSNPEELLADIHKGKIEVLLTCLSSLSEELKELIKEKIPYLITYSKENSVEDFKDALELGTKNYLSLPLSCKELKSALQKASHHLINLNNHPDNKRKGKVITLISSKGGTGKSFIATNLGCLLQKKYNQKVLLIDTVQRFGSIDIMLDFNEKKSMGLIPVDINSYDSYWQEIEDNLLAHKSGVQLLTAGDKNDAPLPIAKLKSILSTAKDKYDYIIIDTEPYFTELNLGLFELSETILYVSTFDIAAIKNLRLGIETLKAYYFSTEKVKLIINRYNKNNELTIPELEKFLKFKITNVIPIEQERIEKSINNGIPFVTDETPGEALTALHSLTDCVAGKECIPVLPKGNDQYKADWLKGLFNKSEGK